MAKKNKDKPRHNGPAFEHTPTNDTDSVVLEGGGTLEQVKEFIYRRRRQVIIHSIIYYRYDDNIISDDVWQTWADQLAKAQNLYPKWVNIGFYDDDFKDWTGATGHDLDLYTLEPTAKALLDKHYQGV